MAPLGELGKFRGGSGFPLRFQGATYGEIPFYKVSDMNLPGNETTMTGANNWVSRAVAETMRWVVHPAGSIVFAKVGAAIFLERKRILSMPSCIDNNMMAFVPDATRCDVTFVHQALMATKLGDHVNATALPSLNSSVLSAIQIPAPPLIDQLHIAAALSNVDALIESLAYGIEKKRLMRDGACHTLLWGGEGGAWPLANFSDVFNRINLRGKKLPTSQFGLAGSWPVVDQSQRPIAGYSDESSLVLRVPMDGVIVFGDHTRQVKFVGSDFIPGADGVQVLETLADNCTEFFAYVLKAIPLPETGYNRHYKFLKVVKVPVPPVFEQTAIAQALSDIDADIDALTRRKEKTELVKSAMAQDLLSGERRVQ
jgi:type I restriction enzyme S subunit